MSDEKTNHPATEVAEILDVVSDRMPRLLTMLRDMLYSPEAAKQMGQAVGTFYKELVAAGMSTEEAQYLTREYMSTLKSVSNMNMNMGNHGSEKHNRTDSHA